MTGASRGIGRSIALELGRAGVQVHAIARDGEALRALTTECDRVFPHVLDLAEDAAVDALTTQFEKQRPKLDLLVHSAGLIAHAPTVTAEIEDLDRMLAVNLRGVYRLTQGLLGSLVESVGDVVFVNSSVTRFPRAHSGQFAATQHALIGFADSLREELNPSGVRVLTVYPGKTATPRQENLHRAAGTPYQPEKMLQPEDVAQVILGALALPRRAEVTEIRIRPSIK